MENTKFTTMVRGLNEMDVLKKVLTIIALAFAVVAFTSSFVRLGQSTRELGQVRRELQRATERERELTAELEITQQRLDTALSTIRDSQTRVEEIQRITERSSERFRYGFEELGNLRRAISEAEEYYTNLEVQLDSLRHVLDYDNSNLEVK